MILKVDNTDASDEESYVSIDSDETLNAVFQIFRKKFSNIFNFTDVN